MNPYAKVGSDVRTSDTIHIPRGYKKLYYYIISLSENVRAGSPS